MNYSIPDYKKPPKALIERSKAERKRRRLCHGNWHECGPEETCQKKS